jgi:hypothetical protein
MGDDCCFAHITNKNEAFRTWSGFKRVEIGAGRNAKMFKASGIFFIHGHKDLTEFINPSCFLTYAIPV